MANFSKLPVIAALLASGLFVTGQAGQDAFAQQVKTPSSRGQAGSAYGYPRDKPPPAIPAYPRDTPAPAGAATSTAGQGRAGGTASTTGAEGSAIRSGDELLARVMAAIEGQGSISAKVRQEVELFDERLIGSGTYLAVAGDTPRWRLEMALRDDDAENLLQQVCDGSQLWIHQRFGPTQELLKIDLEQVARVEKAGGTPDAGVDWGTTGIANLVASWRRAFEFGPVTKTTLQNKTMYRVEGVWRREVLAVLAPELKDKILKGQGVDFGKLGKHLPSSVVIYAGADDLFPYRLEYLRREKTPWYAKLWADDGPRLITAIEFFDVRLGFPIDQRLFKFPLGNLQPRDYTDQYLAKRRWGRVGEGQAATAMK